MEFFEINDFPNYLLVRESERDFYVISNQKGDWERIGTKEKDGHVKMLLYNDKIKRHTRIHVLVAEMFVPNPEGKPIVHHIDFDPSNNDPANLMWVTIEEHMSIHKKGVKRTEDARRKQSNSMKGKEPWNKGKPKVEGAGMQPRAVESIDYGGETKRYESISEASRQTHISIGNICSCCNGKRKTAGKRKWRYAK